MYAIMSAVGSALAALQEKEFEMVRVPQAQIAGNLQGRTLSVDIYIKSLSRKANVAFVLLLVLGEQLGAMENQGNLHHLEIRIQEDETS